MKYPAEPKYQSNTKVWYVSDPSKRPIQGIVNGWTADYSRGCILYELYSGDRIDGPVPETALFASELEACEFIRDALCQQRDDMLKEMTRIEQKISNEKTRIVELKKSAQPEDHDLISGYTAIVSSGNVSRLYVTNFGHLIISSGASVTSLGLGSGGRCSVLSGGFVKYVSVYEGTVHANGGVVSSAYTTNSKAYLLVDNDGEIDTLAISGGMLVVQDGFASNIQLVSGAVKLDHGGGHLDHLLVTGTEADVYLYKGVVSGCNIYGGTLHRNDNVTVSSLNLQAGCKVK